MKLGILIGKPTQFEGPLFRYMAANMAGALQVIYTNPEQMERVFDPEIGTGFSWGIDLLEGYSYFVMPRRNRSRWLLEHLKREKYDLLILNGYKGEYALAALGARFLGTHVALRLDSVLFDNPSPIKRFLKKALFMLFFGIYEHFFAISNLTVQYLRYFGIPEERISLFPYAIDVDYFREKSNQSSQDKHALKQRYGLPQASKVILSVTKFSDREAPWDLLKAFCSMQVPDLWLLLVGDGEQRSRLQEYARERCKQIVFAGYVPYPKLPSIYGIADVFVHPVRDEPWGVSVAEAQACGLPVIASSRVGAGYDLIRPGVNGYIYQVGNARDLEDKLTSLLADSRLDSIRHENERILTYWNYAATLQSVVQVIRQYEKTQPVPFVTEGN